jgi:hypothetical protein
MGMVIISLSELMPAFYSLNPVLFTENTHKEALHLLCSDKHISQAIFENSPIWLLKIFKEINNVNLVWYLWHIFMSYVLGGFINSPIEGVGCFFYMCLFYFYCFLCSFYFSENVTYTSNLKMFVLHGYGSSYFRSIIVFHI